MINVTQEESDAVANHLHRRQVAASGIFVVQVHGLGPEPLRGVASLGIRPTVEDTGRVLLETHVFDFNENVYGRIVKVELLEKIRDEAKYPDLPALQLAIQADAAHARHYFLKKVYV
jgi:riboflavin kinase/FMN adenylyltransferase